MGNFYTDAIRKDARFASLQPIHDLALLEPVTRSKVLAIIADAAAAGIKLMAYETYRSQAPQTRLYHQRATKLKPWACITMGSLATWSKTSPASPRGKAISLFSAGLPRSTK